MLTVADALAALAAEVVRLPRAVVDLPDALGLVLAEDAVSDADSPPFDKALMDGYAVRSTDIVAGRVSLRVIEQVMAGQVPHQPLHTGEATQIMTGAPLPAGADAVVPVELTQRGDSRDNLVSIDGLLVKPGANVLWRGESMKAGGLVIPAGRRLRAQELGCLAELGRHRVAVYPAARVAVLATGDELVPVHETPGPGQIRNSNETLLVAQLRQVGAVPLPLGIARDERQCLKDRILTGLAQDMLLLSGGVSAGQLDLVPAVLAEIGVRQVFHKVRVKPGQPIWFGVYNRLADAGQRPPCFVFGLPGNPVSSMVCFEIFVRTALRRLMGIEPAASESFRAELASDFVKARTRPTWHPAQVQRTPRGFTVTTVPWVGSADLCATAQANALVLFPPGEEVLRAGEEVEVFPL